MNSPENNMTLSVLKKLRDRLLDLTANNRLLNFLYPKKSSLRVVDGVPNDLVEALLANKEIMFLPVREPTEEELIKNGYIEIDPETRDKIHVRETPTAATWAKLLALSTNYESPESAESVVDKKRSNTSLQTLFYPKDLEAILKNLHRNSESAMQEMGANILYLVFGFLRWRDNDKWRSAPLFLVPVHTHRIRVQKTYKFKFRYTGEEIIPNLSLREKFREDFGLVLPDLDESTDPEAYFAEILDMIKEEPRCELQRYICVAQLNFRKQLMYLDLDPRRWPSRANITKHPVVAQLLSSGAIGNDVQNPEYDDMNFGEEHPIDDIEDIHKKYPLVDDADSSQHSALIDVIAGENLVIEGPPGTGKSQTITNLIAAAIAQNKKVLFVAEKLAALEVVHRRLQHIGLDTFCLELHSHKTQRKKVVDSIKERIDMREQYEKPESLDANIQRYHARKAALNDYVEKINRTWKNTGKTMHEIFAAAVRYRKSPNINPVDFYPKEAARYCGENFDARNQQHITDSFGYFSAVYRAVAGEEHGATPQAHPWSGVCNANLTGADSDQAVAALQQWQEALQNLYAWRQAFADTIACKSNEVANAMSEFSALLQEMELLPGLHGDERMDQLPMLRDTRLHDTQMYLRLFEEIQSLYANLAKAINPTVLNSVTNAGELIEKSSRLPNLANPAKSIGDLQKSIHTLHTTQTAIDELAKPMHQIRNAVGEDARVHLETTIAGFTNLGTVIELIGALDSRLWHKRDAIFDNVDLDAVLPQFLDDLKRLRTIRDDLANVFRIESMPGEDGLRKLETTLNAGGIFCWFKSDWRRARREVLDFAATRAAKLVDLQMSLKSAVKFSGEHAKFCSNVLYKKTLGDHFRELDSDEGDCVELRHWYRKVRKKYGMGLGAKVALGDAVLVLPANLAHGIRNHFVDNGALTSLRSLQQNLQTLQSIFQPFDALQNDEMQLTGESGAIARVQSELTAVINDCAPIATDPSVLVKDLLNSIQRLGPLLEKITQWKSLDVGVFNDSLHCGANTDNNSSLSALRNTLHVAQRIRHLTTQRLKSHIYAHPTPDTFAVLSALKENVRNCLVAEQFAFTTFSAMAELNVDDWQNQIDGNLDDLIERNRRALGNQENLHNWLQYLRVRVQISDLGFGAVVVSVEGGAIRVNQAEDVCRAGIFDILAKEILHNHPELKMFSGLQQEEVRKQFKETDISIKNLQRLQIAWKVDRRRVAHGQDSRRATERTDFALLKRECDKQKQHIPIRQLLDRAGDALVSLKPCLMMGPMSVAQYLTPGKIKFDLIVMDEASQIRPEDALGAVARGKQLVVVGDPKQLPPTKFFERMIDSEKNGADEEEVAAAVVLESILDVAKHPFASRRLRWHYRSQHESLIAFSNHSFYQNGLVLFPSPHKDSEHHGICFIRVPHGCFVNKQNAEEARLIAEHVREHFQKCPGDSLGVVAMNAEQRLRIENAIEALAKTDEVFGLRREKDSRNNEHLFIKNLENVQGDERDVIFISMTYGPAESGGRVFQRFGPINHDVGWRRLNVLFTRAKKRMCIFSSMGSGDILPGNQAKRGVHALRNFLRFCETGILHTVNTNTERPPDSDFEIAVMAALRDEGFDCVPQVGVARYFIDVGVLDPDNPGRFLMGIECDGASYHSAKSARDRDRLRQDVLERLGWKICRIWSTDWFHNPAAELRPIIKKLKRLQAQGA